MARNSYSAIADNQEYEYPETVFVRDIENKVFQGIVLQCLSTIDGIALLEGGFIDNIFSRGSVEGIKGIASEQDSKSQSVKVTVELNVAYGISIPDKAEEIQTKVSEQLVRLTGLHVSSVHVIFKGIIPPHKIAKMSCITHQTTAEAPVDSGQEDIG